MVANNIDAIRHGTLIKVQVYLQEKYSTNVIERVQNKKNSHQLSLHYNLNLEQKMKIQWKWYWNSTDPINGLGKIF